MENSKPLSTKEIIRLSREHTFFSWSIQGNVNPIHVDKAQGVYFWDGDGKRYIDFSAQLMNQNTGHQHPKVIQAIKDQAEKLCFVHPGMTTEVRAILGKKIAEITPGDINKTFFCLGGAEANENAIKISRQYSGKHKILSRYRSYHGATLGAITLTGDPRRLAAEPAISGVVHFLDPHCYRCPFGWTKTTCNRECIKHVEEILIYEGPDQVAAIIMEGVTGSNGIIIPPDDYWPRLREICDKYGILLISDEVMSGWGRTGKWFAVDHWNVIPDIITTAKGITSGYIPLGAVIVSQKIADYFEDKMMWCGLTYNGHPLACAAAVATIDVYKDDQLIENAAQLGHYLGNRLERLKEKHDLIGDVRYIGLFSTIEMVSNRETKQPLDSNQMVAIGKYLKENGLFTYIMNSPNGTMLFIVPPLCITKQELDFGLDIIDSALEEFE